MKRVERLKTKQNNQVYSRTEQEAEPKNLNWFKLFLIFLFIGGAVYLLFFSDFFKIRNIEAEGYSHPEAVKGIAAEMVQKNIFSSNIFLFNLRELENTLSGDSRIEEVTVKRIFPNKIIIIIKESQASLIWESAGEKFLIDGRGVVMTEATDENYPTVYDASNINVSPGERVASPTFIKFIKEITEGFGPATGVNISKITILDILTDVHILSSDGFVVYFDSSKTAEGQLKNLTRVLGEAKKAGTKLEYIDMRLDNKIFYK